MTMLIVPLHRVPTWTNFPWVTLGLVVANVLVFALLQSGDARAQATALDRYLESGLDRIEFPAYARWLRSRDADDAADAFVRVAGSGPRLAVRVLQDDAAFVAALADGRVLPFDATEADGHAALEAWRAARADFAQAWDAVFTRRWMLHFDRFEPVNLAGSTFLHAGVGHLVGNMLFLAVLGLLVEGALGAALFLGLYLLGGIGASLVSLACHWGNRAGHSAHRARSPR